MSAHLCGPAQSNERFSTDSWREGEWNPAAARELFGSPSPAAHSVSPASYLAAQPCILPCCACRPPRPEQDATLPDGVTSYGQLAMASDAPRFVRASANVADISPQRLHPTRLFFPRTTYAPAVSCSANYCCYMLAAAVALLPPLAGRCRRCYGPRRRRIAACMAGVLAPLPEPSHRCRSRAFTRHTARPPAVPSAQDLDPYKTTAAAAAGTLEEVQETGSRAAEVGRYADYKNAPLLASFLSGEWQVVALPGGRVLLSAAAGQLPVRSIASVGCRCTAWWGGMLFSGLLRRLQGQEWQGRCWPAVLTGGGLWLRQRRPFKQSCCSCYACGFGLLLPLNTEQCRGLPHHSLNEPAHAPLASRRCRQAAAAVAHTPARQAAPPPVAPGQGCTAHGHP